MAQTDQTTDGLAITGAGEPVSARAFINAADKHAGYSLLSVILHGFTAVTVVWLSVSGLMASLLDHHTSIGLVLSVPMAVIAVRRWVVGYPRVADEALTVAFIDRLALTLILLAIVVLALTGITISGLVQIAAATGSVEGEGITGWIATSSLGQWTSALHRAAGMVLIAAAGLHIVLLARHFWPAAHRKYVHRIIKPVAGGR